MILQLNGTNGTADLYGISSITVPFIADSLAEVVKFLSDTAALDGIPMANGSTFQQQDDGTYLINAKYEGVAPDSQPSELAVVEFNFDGSMEKESMKTHPKFLSLKDLYGWDEEKGEFQEYLPETAANKGLNQKTTEPKKSPIAGVSDWLAVGGEYSVTFARREVPGSIFSDIGTLIKTPPGIGAFNIQLGKRTFLKLAPQVTKRGNAVQIRDRYLMSNPVGHPEIIYSQAQLGT